MDTVTEALDGVQVTVVAAAVLADATADPLHGGGRAGRSGGGQHQPGSSGHGGSGQVYLFEFKTEEPEGTALAQLKEKAYVAKYRHLGRPIHLIGVEFGRVESG